MQEEWDACASQLALITDALGKPIDAEIFETVVALNMLNIPTVMSCGGHLTPRRGLLLPWVDIEPTDSRLAQLRKEEVLLIEQATIAQQTVAQLQTEHDTAVQITDAHTMAATNYRQLREVQRQIRILRSEVRIRLAEFLSIFYHTRQVSFDRQLILSGLGRTRLHSQGSLDFYLVAPEKLQSQKLQEYREEMALFTIFLKHIYFAPKPYDQLLSLHSNNC